LHDCCVINVCPRTTPMHETAGGSDHLIRQIPDACVRKHGRKNIRMVFKLSFAALASFALSFTAAPALANETATSAQITGAVQTSNTPAATGDREFQELFASWKSMDATGVASATPVPTARVSVPS